MTACAAAFSKKMSGKRGRRVKTKERKEVVLQKTRGKQRYTEGTNVCSIDEFILECVCQLHVDKALNNVFLSYVVFHRLIKGGAIED